MTFALRSSLALISVLSTLCPQYVLTDGEAGYIAVDEGDYGALPKAMLDRVIDTVPGKLSDEF
ncbi:MAG TPA: hypothetical protein PKL10_17330 [Nitrospira sp.]|nr:hypothetical protein [Nitrospira sp.]HNN44066.1 hypothetical protein [Nitrospira sp.]